MLLAYAKLTLDEDLLESAVPDDPYLGPRARPLFPQSHRRALPRRARAPSPAPRDHRHPARQFDDQPRRPVADRAHRRPDRRCARRHRRGLRRRARQLWHDRAQHRDRRARQYRCRENCSSSFTRRCRTSCSTASSGSCAMSICPKAWPRSWRITATASPRSKPRSTARCPRRVCARARARKTKLVEAGVPEELAGRLSNLPSLAAAPDIVLVADRTGKPIGEVAATYFAASAFFRLDRITSAASNIPIADYFDRLALDRARDSIGEAERRLAAAMVGDGAAGAARGRGLGGAAPRRGRARSAGGSRDRQFRADAVETGSGRKPARRLGQELKAGKDLPTGAAARHKKEPQAEYALGVLGVAST